MMKVIKKLAEMILILVLFFTFPCKSESAQYRVYPVLFVHGIGDNFINCWVKDGDAPGFFNPYYDCYNQKNIFYGESNPSELLNWDNNEFGISFSQPTGSIEGQAQELDWVINGHNEKDGICQIMSASYPGIFSDSEDVKVVIIAHSMGGLSAREYIRNHPGNHHIAKLITVDSPHHGSWQSDPDVLNTYLLDLMVDYIFKLSFGTFLTLFPPSAAVGWGFIADGFFEYYVRETIYNQWIDAGLVGTPAADEMIPGSSFLTNLNTYYRDTPPTDLDYHLIAGLSEKTKIVSYFLQIPELNNGDGVVALESQLGQDWISMPLGNYQYFNYFKAIPILSNAPHFIVDGTCHNSPLETAGAGISIRRVHNTILRALEDPPTIDTVSLFNSDSKPLSNNALQDITNPKIIITGSIWDYLLNKTNAKLSFSYQPDKTINFNTFGYFCESVTLAGGGKNLVGCI